MDKECEKDFEVQDDGKADKKQKSLTDYRGEHLIVNSKSYKIDTEKVLSCNDVNSKLNAILLIFSKMNIRIQDFAMYILYFISSILSLMGSVFAIPVWLLFSFLIEKYRYYLQKTIQIDRQLDKLTFVLISSSLLLISIFAANILLSIGVFPITISLIILAIIFRNQRSIPLVEMVYISIILGVIAGKIGLLI